MHFNHYALNYARNRVAKGNDMGFFRTSLEYSLLKDKLADDVEAGLMGIYCGLGSPIPLMLAGVCAQKNAYVPACGLAFFGAGLIAIAAGGVAISTYNVSKTGLRLCSTLTTDLSSKLF